MEAGIFERIRGSLLETRHNLSDWLSRTPSPERDVRLGPASEGAMYAHLQVLDTSLEKVADQTLGVCTVCHEYVDPELLEMDYTACVCLDHFSEQEKRQLESELELSQVVQRGFLPQVIPDIPGLELAAFSRPAQILGGDYFDFLRFRDGGYGLAIADVAGHGISASMLMASVQTALRSLAPVSDLPIEVLGPINRIFVHNIHFNTFVTLFLAHFDPATRRLTYANAGHNPPLVYCPKPNGREAITWLRPTGAAVGLVEEAQFRSETLTLAPGDVLLLYTDGVTESRNPGQEQFGEHRLAELVQEGAGLPANELVRGLRQAMQDFSAGQPLDDDTTIVACKAV
jgi:sigma-B regulation protein RsbU (phosphoserine phosphatase)